MNRGKKNPAECLRHSAGFFFLGAAEMIRRPELSYEMTGINAPADLACERCNDFAESLSEQTAALTPAPAERGSLL